MVMYLNLGFLIKALQQVLPERVFFIFIILIISNIEFLTSWFLGQLNGPWRPFRVLLRFYSQFDIFYFHSSKVLFSIYVFEAPSLRCHLYLHDVYSWKLYFMYNHYYFTVFYKHYLADNKLIFKLRLILTIFKSILKR